MNCKLICEAYSNHQHKDYHYNEECKKQAKEVKNAHSIIHPRVSRVAVYLLLTVLELTRVEKWIIIAIVRAIGSIFACRMLDTVSCNHNCRV